MGSSGWAARQPPADGVAEAEPMSRRPRYIPTLQVRTPRRVSPTAPGASSSPRAKPDRGGGGSAQRAEPEGVAAPTAPLYPPRGGGSGGGGPSAEERMVEGEGRIRRARRLPPPPRALRCARPAVPLPQACRPEGGRNAVFSRNETPP